jgi:hypothetical protein
MKQEKAYVFRLENVNIRELLELLSAVYEQSDTTDIVLDFKTQDIFIEPPDNVKLSGPFNKVYVFPQAGELPIEEIDKIKMDDELFRILTTRK